MKPLHIKTLAIGLTFLSFFGSRVAVAETERDRAWDILQATLNDKSTEKRAIAVHVLALLPGDTRALDIAEKAVTDDKPEVRAAAAAALGQMHAKSSVPLLHKLLDDPEPSVAFAAASALIPYKDPAAYEAYYEFLTGERKTDKGKIAKQVQTLRDPKKMAVLGVEEGVGFVPFAGIGVYAVKAMVVDDVSPVRAAAAKMLTNDPDPQSGQALVEETSDKSWLVRTAALEAIAKRGDPKLLDGISDAMLDDNTSVRCTAAAAVIRLSTLESAKTIMKPMEPAGK